MGDEVSFGSVGLRVGDDERVWLSAEVHAWRLDPRCWAAVLDSVVDAGFGFVSTYLPWSRHEVAPGAFDFTGSRDLAAFAELVADRGLGLYVRPGPDAGSELPDSGWPARVCDDPRCQALRPDGRPYVLPTATWHVHPPSYASEVFLGEVARWYDAVCAVVEPLLHPHGPVVAVQVDNEMGYHFQPHPFALDHHPDAIASFRRYLRRRYVDLSPLNDSHGTAWRSFEEVAAPRDGDDGSDALRLDWLAFKEQHLRDAVGTLGRMLRERGMTVPLVHNDYPRTNTPHDVGALEASGAVDVAAADVYATREGSRYVRDLARRLAGSVRLPFLVELGAGWLTLPWLLPLGCDADDERVVAQTAVWSGVRAANVYMAVERDRWYGSPIARDGTPRPKAAMYRELAQTMGELSGLRRWAPVLVVSNHVAERRAEADALGADLVAAFAQVLPLDRRLFSGTGDAELRAWEADVAEMCDRAGVDSDRASTAALPELNRYEMVLVACTDAMDPEAWDVLVRAAAEGVRVFVGPRMPTLDDRLRLSAFQTGNVVPLVSPGDAVRLLPSPPYQREPAVDLHLWRGEGRDLVAAANGGGGEIDVCIIPGPGALTDEGWTASLGPWEVRAWEVRAGRRIRDLAALAA